MLNAFAALEARVDDSVIDRLANAWAVTDADPFRVIFDEAYADPLGVATSSPICTCATLALGASGQGSTILIDRTPGLTDVGPAAVAYVIANVEPDGGLTLLRLREVANG